MSGVFLYSASYSIMLLTKDPPISYRNRHYLKKRSIYHSLLSTSVPSDEQYILLFTESVSNTEAITVKENVEIPAGVVIYLYLKQL